MDFFSHFGVFFFFHFLGGIFLPFSGGGGDSVCSKMPNDQTSHQFGCVESLS